MRACAANQSPCGSGWLPSHPCSRRRHNVGACHAATAHGGGGCGGGGPSPAASSSSHTITSSSSPLPVSWQEQLSALSRRAAACALAAVVAGTAALAPLAPPPADAVTQEQLLFLEAWRAVDRAFVDKKFNGQNWFKVR